MNVAYVYSGPGAGSRSVQSAVEALKRNFNGSVRVDTIDKRNIVESTWEHNCSLLVMPGGADLPYCKQLNGAGNKRIRRFVEQGGAYMGLCAGSYYACQLVEFEKGNQLLEVTGKRELGFFPGTARGSAYPGFEYETEKGAVAAPIRYVVSENGGDTTTWKPTVDYVNGGPLFCQSTTGQNIRINTPIQDTNIEILATYPELNHAASALKIRVQAGVCVLCSSHPELHSHWLQGSVATISDHVETVLHADESVLQEDYKYMLHVKQLYETLKQHEIGRNEFFRTLLVACGFTAEQLTTPCDIALK